MARKSEKNSSLMTSPMKTSNQPIGGSVVGLHIVQNFRTKDKYIVGGGDDGSIAFWSLMYVGLNLQSFVISLPTVQYI